MKRAFTILSLAVALAAVATSSCVHKAHTNNTVPDGNYPQEIANILVAKCATAGCHNAASYTNANNVRLDTWEHLFEGSNSGAIVVPFSPQYSPLLYFVNTDSSQGVVSTPTMPYTTSSTPATPLTKAEYETLKTWIANGAPGKDGKIAFASNAEGRQKIYVTQQGCDQMGVIDGQSHLVMRYLPIGTNSAQIESPHCTRVASDGSYAYVSFLAGSYVQKIDTKTDQVVAAANVGSLRFNGSWNILYLAPADTALVTSSWQADGILGYVKTAGMNVTHSLGGGNSLVYPHGITSTMAFDTFFITAQYGNVIYRFSANQLKLKQISLDGNPPVASTSSTSASPNPHEILMVPDFSRYFVTCQGTNQVKVLDAHKDSVIATIPVGSFPQEMAISRIRPYIFVTCMEDNSPNPGMKGSVYAINYNTLEVQRIDGDFYQPHGITVDDINGLLYVVSTNASADGPAPHHATACNGRAGWYSIIKLSDFQPYNNKRYQVLVSPYSAAARFK
jgi:YVTN family beta-propeller protein